jgi:hypothetical protein
MLSTVQDTKRQPLLMPIQFSYVASPGVFWIPARRRRLLASHTFRLLPMLLLWCVSANAIAAEAIAEPLTSDSYAQLGNTHGVVLFSVRWDRYWWCGGFEHAQLQKIAFDKLPSRKRDSERPDILLSDAPVFATKPIFDNYALLLEPGEYGLSEVEIKVARSASDVGSLSLTRSTLLQAGQPQGGGFSVSPGEIVYIGHFYLDCTQEPTLWRYYADGREAYDEYLAEVKRQRPMLDITKARFRLFQTNTFGRSYELP